MAQAIGGQAVLEGVMMRGPRNWAVAVRKPGATAAEATRVLRPGGHFGMQDLVLAEPDAVSAPSPCATADDRAAALAATGLVEITVRDLTAHARDQDARTERAWHAFAERRGPDDGMVAARARLANDLSTGRLRVVQLTARRP